MYNWFVPSFVSSQGLPSNPLAILIVQQVPAVVGVGVGVGGTKVGVGLGVGSTPQVPVPAFTELYDGTDARLFW